MKLINTSNTADYWYCNIICIPSQSCKREPYMILCSTYKWHCGLHACMFQMIKSLEHKPCVHTHLQSIMNYFSSPLPPPHPMHYLNQSNYLQVSCIAVAGILQYFFTAAFAWLFCEALLISLFDWVAKRWAAFILFFLIGWGKPLNNLQYCSNFTWRVSMYMYHTCCSVSLVFVVIITVFNMLYLLLLICTTRLACHSNGSFSRTHQWPVWYNSTVRSLITTKFFL